MTQALLQRSVELRTILMYLHFKKLIVTKNINFLNFKKLVLYMAPQFREPVRPEYCPQGTKYVVIKWFEEQTNVVYDVY